MKRRLRQHNGEISGGAKYTRKGRPWTHFVYVSGFPTNSLAMCFEWSWKHKRKRGKKGVLNALEKVGNKSRWTKKCPLASTIPLEIFCIEKIDIKLPKSVCIVNGQSVDEGSSE